MFNNRKENTGFLLVSKPEGITSHDVVDYLRKITGIKKIGHSGTLDPFAEGLLIIGIGKEATKKLSYFLKMDKEYIAKIKLGEVSSTYDREGKIKKREVKKIPSREEVEETIKEFVGTINQVPPIFSAKKIKGKRLYEIARKGEKTNIEPVMVKIYEIKILDYKFPYLKLNVHCGSGTYIRSLAHDIGKKLGVGGYLEELCRTRIGEYKIEDAYNLKEITSENWQDYLFNSDSVE